MKITIEAKFLDGLDLVLSQKFYLALAIALVGLIGFFYAVSSNLIYLQPIFFINTYNLFNEGFANMVTGVLFLVTAPILAGLTLTVLVYKINQLRNLRASYREAGIGGLGMFAGIFTSTCPECVPLFLYCAGVSYSLFAAVVAPYLIWIRFLAITILSISFYYASREVTNLCGIKSKKRGGE